MGRMGRNIVVGGWMGWGRVVSFGSVSGEFGCESVVDVAGLVRVWRNCGCCVAVVGVGDVGRRYI